MAGFGERVRHWGSLAFANPLAFFVTFTTGGMIAFLYSYIPLHNVNDRKVATLSEQVIVQETKIDELERTLEAQQEAAADAPDPAALAVLDQESATARAERDKAAASLVKAEKRIARLEKERREWRRKVATLEEQRDELLTAGSKASVTTLPATAAPTEPGDAAPAAPASASPNAAIGADSQAAASRPDRAVAGAQPPAGDPAGQAAPAAPASDASDQ